MGDGVWFLLKIIIGQHSWEQWYAGATHLMMLSLKTLMREYSVSLQAIIVDSNLQLRFMLVIAPPGGHSWYFSQFIICSCDVTWFSKYSTSNRENVVRETTWCYLHPSAPVLDFVAASSSSVCIFYFMFNCVPAQVLKR